MSNSAEKLSEIYDALLGRYGPQGWWPADTPTEVIIGAILVQHTSWKNVETAIGRLRRHGLLDFRAIAACDETELADVIRVAGTPMVKSRRLQAFAERLGERYGFDLAALLARPTESLRVELLSIKGIGPETADCIVLYAAGRPTFVVDAYTQRVLARHLLADSEWGRDELKEFVESNLPSDAEMFNEYHALLVRVGKEHCRTRARCGGCPLEHLEHEIEQRCD